MKQYYMVIDVDLCHDCNNCFMACKDEHVDNDWPGYTAPQPRHGHRWMNIERRERGQYARNDVAYLPMPCQHCENAPCIAASNGAIKRRDDGIVMIDAEKAKGNQKLKDACPYGAIYWNDEVATPQKCTFCAHLLDDKEWKPAQPRCSHTCPTGALKFFAMEPADFEKMKEAEDLKAYKEELGTNPHVVYKNLHKFTHNFITAGVLVDGDCYEGATVNLKSKDGGMVCRIVGTHTLNCEDTSVIDTQTTNFFGEFKFDGLKNGEYVVEIEGAGRKASVSAVIENESLNLGFINL